MKRTTILSILLSLSGLLSMQAHANLNVLACEPEWAALTETLAGDKASVYSATTALQDPHQVQARPSLIAKVRNADLLVCTGLELEIGWLPVLLQQSGNAKIQAGQPGYFMAGDAVPKLEVPSRLDRSEGDVHAAGNPHIQQDPHNIARVAEALVKRLATLDPANAALYQSRYQDFSTRWQAAMLKWEQQAAPLKGIAVVTHHKDMVYLLHWLGMHELGTLEPKPGMEPSGAHLAELVTLLQQQPAKMVLRTPYQSERPSQWLADHAHIPAVMLPCSVGGTDAAKDLFGFYDDTIRRLLESAR